MPLDGAVEPLTADPAVSIAVAISSNAAFRRLPPDQRALLVLRHYLGLEPNEIAETLGIPAGHGPFPTALRPSRDARRPRSRRSPRDGRRTIGMTTPDIEPILDDWLGEGTDILPDRSVEAVLRTVERPAQRSAWRAPWRTTTVNHPSRIRGLASAAIARRGGQPDSSCGRVGITPPRSPAAIAPVADVRLVALRRPFGDCV